MYYNLIYQYGAERFFADFHEAGVNSVLVADLSIDDAEEISDPAEAAGLETVFMVTSVTEPERMKLIASKTTGFIYTVSVLGVTGSRDELSDTVEEEADRRARVRGLRNQQARTRRSHSRGRRGRRDNRLQSSRPHRSQPGQQTKDALRNLSIPKRSQDRHFTGLNLRTSYLRSFRAQARSKIPRGNLLEKSLRGPFGTVAISTISYP